MYVIRCLMKQARSHTVPRKCWLEWHPPSHQSPHLQKILKSSPNSALCCRSAAWLVHPKKALRRSAASCGIGEPTCPSQQQQCSTTRLPPAPAPAPAAIESLPPPSLPTPSRAEQHAKQPAPALDSLPMSLAHVRFQANHSVQATGIEELGLPRAPAESMLRRIISSYRRALRPTWSNRCWLSMDNASLSNKDRPLMPTTIILTIHTADVQQLVNRRAGSGM